MIDKKIGEGCLPTDDGQQMEPANLYAYKASECGACKDKARRARRIATQLPRRTP